MAAVRSCSNPTCGNTESRAGEFKNCSRCKQTCYCSKECQMAHWKNGHRQECKALQTNDNSNSTVSEKKSEGNNDQVILLRKECQDMYNNYEMSKDDLDQLKKKLEEAKITQKKLVEVDSAKDIYCSHGSMYMLHQQEDAASEIQSRIDKLSLKIETTTKQVSFYEKRYKEYEANLNEM